MPATAPTTNLSKYPADAIGPGDASWRSRVLKKQTYRWLSMLTLALMGLAVFGRGFAYLGLPPLFVTEIVLAWGLGLTLFLPRWSEVYKSTAVLCMLVLMAWTAWRTLPYLAAHGIDAPRDAAIVGYGLFAIVIASVIIAFPQTLAWLIQRYRTLAAVGLVALLFAIAIRAVLGDAMPSWPWANVSIVSIKPGDVAVHLGAVTALGIVGLWRPKGLLWPLLIFILIAVLGSQSRAGLLSWGLAFCIAFALRPKGRLGWEIALVGLVIIVVALAIDLRVNNPERSRDYSARQLVHNAMSVIASKESGDLQGTKTWRLNWWTDVVNYTFYGEYFWMGKGFGVNLATDDGYQVTSDEALRGPHNGHITILARAGVPGLAMWILMHLAWLITIFNGYLRSRQRGDLQWSGVFIWLLAVWAAIMLNASFDVYLEGPMGGVWFWVIFGIGISAAWIYQRYPEILADDLAEVHHA